jgi:hypothetical protein
MQRSAIMLRAIVLLVSLLDPQSEHWNAVEADLEELAALGHWQAQKALAQRWIAAGYPDRATAFLKRGIKEAQNLHEWYAAAILFADVLREVGRTLEAWLLIRRIEAMAGTGLLDIGLRFECLRVSAAVATARGEDGDAAARSAAAVYHAALQELQQQ